MAPQLIICGDGTNVSQLCELLSPDTQNQRLYYDPGGGNPGKLPGASSADRLGRRYERLHSLVFGNSIYDDIAEAYRFIMRNWLPGDKIYLFGFSRGAFTARSVGGLVTQFGILRPDMDGLMATLLHTYFSNREERGIGCERIRAQIRAQYSDGAARNAPVWFVGVWDTVASVGTPLLSHKITAVPTIVGKNYCHVRQALTLDEYRRNFQLRPYRIDPSYDYAGAGQSIKQHWFSSAHCDVGGGYRNAKAGLSQQTLIWMVQETASCGLRLRLDLLNSTGQPDPALLIQHLNEKSFVTGLRQKLVHSETYDAPLWTLGGQMVRNFHDNQDSTHAAAPPTESGTVVANGLIFPAGTVWRQSRLLRPAHAKSRRCDKSARNYLTHPASLALLASLAVVVFWFAAGALLLGPEAVKGNPLGAQMMPMFGKLPQVVVANRDFAARQLPWATQGSMPTQGLGSAVHSMRALLVNFGFIAAYSYLLAFGVAWAFARIARLRRVAMKPNRLLNVLGMGASIAVLADVAENALGLALLLIYPNAYLPGLEVLPGLLMAGAALAKWAGLAGSFALVVWACITASSTRSQE